MIFSLWKNLGLNIIFPLCAWGDLNSLRVILEITAHPNEHQAQSLLSFA